LLGTLVLHLFFLCVFFQNLNERAIEVRDHEMKLRKQIESQNHRSDGIVTNVPNHQP
jgi:cell division protein FtsL